MLDRHAGLRHGADGVKVVDPRQGVAIVEILLHRAVPFGRICDGDLLFRSVEAVLLWEFYDRCHSPVRSRINVL